MDPQVSTSFIPKKPLVEGRRGSSAGLIFLIALLIFIGSVVAAGAAFLYGAYLNRAIVAKAQQLETAQGAFESAGAIENLIRLDNRLTQAKGLLASHVSPSAIFFFLSAQTLERVRFTSFGYELREDGSASIQMEGITDGFPSMALQSDQFGASKVLRNIVFADPTVEPEGGVTFSFSAAVEPALVLYSKNLTQEPVNILPPAPQVTAPATSTSATSSPASTSTSTQ